jgi:hypothetical protein
MKQKHTRITKEITDGVLKHYAENKSIIKASKHFDIGLATANRILKKNGIARDGRHKSNNKNWAGGKCMAAGYVKIRDPLNIMRDSRGYVWEHRLVMAKHIGRPLLRTEVVHHIDENKSNNDITNLILFGSQAEHISHHRSINDKRTM